MNMISKIRAVVLVMIRRALLIIIMLFPVIGFSQNTTPFNPSSFNSILNLLLEDECYNPNRHVYEGNLVLRTQSDIDVLSSFGKIVGDVRLDPVTDLNLSAFDGLVEITGYLRMDDSSVQTRISGFNCLKTVGDSILIYGNSALVEIAGFERLETVKHLEITRSDALTRLSGFSSLKTIIGDLYLNALPKLEVLPYFSALETIGSFLNIRALQTITDIPGFVNLVSIGRYLSIRANFRIERVSGFDRLSSFNVGEDINISSNIKWDCQTYPPTFSPVTISTNNLTNCTLR